MQPLAISVTSGATANRVVQLSVDKDCMPSLVLPTPCPGEQTEQTPAWNHRQNTSQCQMRTCLSLSTYGWHFVMGVMPANENIGLACVTAMKY